MTAFGSVDNAVEAMKLGAFDYVNKPFRTEELLLTLERALHQTALRREVAQLRRTRRRRARSHRRPVARHGAHVRPRRARRADPRHVLITGETGTGKELVARAIHELSDRARKPFVPINCSALPETLLESELFGHTKGSFTGAIANKRGLFEEAAGGTLFLDEISTIPPSIQVKLLRVLQERKLHRIGGSQPDRRRFPAPRRHQPRPRRGGPRRPVPRGPVLPPQRVPRARAGTARAQSDIPLLANYFRLRFAQENGVEAPEISPDTMKRLMEYAWPGNVRELENYIERAVIMYSGARSMPFEAPAATSSRPGAAPRRHGPARALEHGAPREGVHPRRAAADGGHRGHAAEILGIDRRTLYRKLKQYAPEGDRSRASRLASCPRCASEHGRWIAMMPPTTSTSASTTGRSARSIPTAPAAPPRHHRAGVRDRGSQHHHHDVPDEHRVVRPHDSQQHRGSAQQHLQVEQAEPTGNSRARAGAAALADGFGALAFPPSSAVGGRRHRPLHRRLRDDRVPRPEPARQVRRALRPVRRQHLPARHAHASRALPARRRRSRCPAASP
jgi:DNA-binding NtrC family response regulator